MNSSCARPDRVLNTDQVVPKPPMVLCDTVQYLSNNIKIIFQDSKGNHWFGSWKDGLFRYDGHMILQFTTKSGLPHNRVEEIQEDSQGRIYINTSEGLCIYNGNGFSILEPRESDLWVLQPEDLWFRATQYRDKVFRFDGSELYLLPLPKSEMGEEWIAGHPSPVSPYDVYTIYKDSHGNIWFGMAALGTFRFNGTSFDWISEEDVHELHDGPSNGVRSIIEDKEGYFWFNSAYRYQVYGLSNKKSEPFYKREKSIGNLDGLSGSDLWEYLSITRDNENVLWIATYNMGVWSYNGVNTAYFPILSNGKDITSFYIYKDNQGELWLGTHENGVYLYNGKSFEPFSPE